MAERDMDEDRDRKRVDTIYSGLYEELTKRYYADIMALEDQKKMVFGFKHPTHFSGPFVDLPRFDAYIERIGGARAFASGSRPDILFYRTALYWHTFNTTEELRGRCYSNTEHIFEGKDVTSGDFYEETKEKIIVQGTIVPVSRRYLDAPYYVRARQDNIYRDPLDNRVKVVERKASNVTFIVNGTLCIAKKYDTRLGFYQVWKMSVAHKKEMYLVREDCRGFLYYRGEWYGSYYVNEAYVLHHLASDQQTYRYISPSSAIVCGDNIVETEATNKLTVYRAML